ncbi:hypothetical protein [Spirosoma validum]|uniref:DUF4468 domain-containing protein n=1 Tax=Spirosoma validum TaxID=2771355 RepID=A0A927AZR2_9BACT|nr:hypothetical protein [Spirosoma validum]MBD2752642.1 hypothetical protein [Spirosoma validum]
MKKIVLRLLLLLPLVSQATCVVVIRNDKEIIVGQDSRRIIVNDKGIETGFKDDYCKIREVNGFYYTLVGANDQLQIEVANSVKDSKSVEEFAFRFSQELGLRYEIYLEELLKKSTENYNKWFPGTYPLVSEIAIFKVENSKPTLFVSTFNIANKSPGSNKVVIDIKGNVILKVLGYNQEYYYMPAEERSQLRSLANTEPYKFIEKVISLAKEKYPNRVGGEIYYFTLSDDKKKWLPKEPKS